jgi:hypothetical protein
MEPSANHELATSSPLPPPAAPIRALVEAGVGGRYSGPSRSAWAVASARVTVPFDEWSAAIWLRAAVPAPLDRTPQQFSGSDVAIGVAGGVRLLRFPVELYAALEPSIAVVSMRGGEEPNLLEGSRVAFRMGASLRLVRALGDTFRGFVSLDGETEPAGWAAPRHIDAELPGLPVAGAGLSLGLQAVLR